MDEVFAKLREAGELSAIDEQLARGLGRMADETRPEVLLAVARASRATRLGHVCIDAMGAQPDGALLDSRLVGGPGDVTPLVIDAGRLYLRRFHRYETRLAEALAERVDHLDASIDGPLLRAGLDRLFPPDASRRGAGELDFQRVAALVAVARRFCIISGGPGTGKTTTVVKILALLAAQAKHAGKKLHAALVAPTGKAAARLRESIIAQREKLDLEPELLALVPDDASTIHRALKPTGGPLPRFRHDADNPLPVDLVIVDEASMVDLALMSKLVLALPKSARLVLLGDRNQLASVDAGAILGDLCGPARPPGFSSRFAAHVGKLTGDALPIAEGPAIADCVVELRKNHRYPTGSGIHRLARAVNDGDADAALAVLGSKDLKDVVLHPGIEPRTLAPELRRAVIAGYSGYATAATPRAAFDALGRFRVLAAHRRGPFGVEELNPLITELLGTEGLIHPVEPWYSGRPVLVTRNDYQVELFNGDVGIVLPDDVEAESARVWFPTPEGGMRKLAPSRLPSHETVFAMTVHKAQGSEFDEVLVVLPDESSKALTRELLYTAITRPKHRVLLSGGADVIAAAVNRPIERASGLRARLWR